jgi:hypothetical protein
MAKSSANIALEKEIA